jgi:BASS family bile acid:Na+ symporter
VGLPVALAIIMLGLGLHLTLNDFTRILKKPKAIFVGLFAQMIVLPFICFFIAKVFMLSPEMAVGLMLLAASPGGTSANLYSHLFKGDVALNISLTAINSLLVIVSIPLIITFSMGHFMSAEQAVPLQFQKVLEVMAIVIIPVTIGIYINMRFPNASKKADKPVKLLSVILLVILVVFTVLKEQDRVLEYFKELGGAVTLFCVLSIVVGYGAGKLFSLKEKESRALAFEIGVHNGALAIFLAMSVLKNPTMAIPAASYSLVMFLLAFVFGTWVQRKQPLS